MNNYINELDCNFVTKFSESLNLKDFYAEFRKKEGWYVFFNKSNEFVLLCNYGIYSSFDDEFNKKATNLWQVEMYKKFGKKYLRSLKLYEYRRLNFKRKNEYMLLKNNIHKIERAL